MPVTSAVSNCRRTGSSASMTSSFGLNVSGHGASRAAGLVDSRSATPDDAVETAARR